MKEQTLAQIVEMLEVMNFKLSQIPAQNVNGLSMNETYYIIDKWRKTQKSLIDMTNYLVKLRDKD